MSEFVDELAAFLVSGGVGQFYAGGLVPSDTTVQTAYRRDTPAHVILLRQVGGLAFPHEQKELQTFQVLVDGPTISGAKAKARQVHDLLHETTMTDFGGHKVMWLRAVTLPQVIPVMSALGELKERFQFSGNFQALLVLSGTA